MGNTLSSVFLQQAGVGLWGWAQGCWAVVSNDVERCDLQTSAGSGRTVGYSSSMEMVWLAWQHFNRHLSCQASSVRLFGSVESKWRGWQNVIGTDTGITHSAVVHEWLGLHLHLQHDFLKKVRWTKVRESLNIHYALFFFNLNLTAT